VAISFVVIVIVKLSGRAADRSALDLPWSDTTHESDTLVALPIAILTTLDHALHGHYTLRVCPRYAPATLVFARDTLASHRGRTCRSGSPTNRSSRENVALL